MFRPAAVYRNSTAVVSCGDRVIMKKKAMIYTPGEMAVLELKKEQIQSMEGDSITVRIERS